MGTPRAEGLEETVPASEPPEEEQLADPDKNEERYRLGTELGRGGMGRVVEAFDVQLGRTVALKEVLPKGGPGTVRRFTREVQLTARLEHPSIVPLYDAGTGPDGRPYYVMRRVTGRPLDELIGRARGLGERLTLVPAVLAAIDAVAHAHRRGVIHRDLKPANILVGELGETVVIDWGLAKVIGEDDETGDAIMSAGDSLQTQMGSVFGTPGFMAPEQARGEELSTQGDVYALGATLYHLLAGTPPHAGNSATEVIDKTSRLEVRPLTKVAPGTPPELVAIVGKALAFDPASRYANAGALGEDVRRFLSGQLVAAHNYTSRQKLGRFARKHRGALAVAALATVAVAVLAWFAVHRIVTERDVATEARHQALIDKKAAEEARDRLAERHDALVVMQANALLDANPTEAIAILKQLSAKSPRLADARAIAQAASLRGVAWAMQGPREMSVIAELSPDGKRLLQVTIDGKVRIWDLEMRRLVIERPFIEQTRAAWVAGGRVLAWNKKVSPLLLDPNTSTAETLAVPPISEAVVTDRGDLAAVIVVPGGAGVLDIATKRVRMLSSERDVKDLEIAPDGSRIAVGSRSGLVVFDRDGKELARKLGYFPVFEISRSGSLAAISDRTVFELRPGPQPVWTEIPLELEGSHRPLVIMYRGSDLMLLTSKSELLQWNGRVLYRRKQFDSIGPMIRETGLESLALATPNGKLEVIYPLGVASIPLPHIVKGLRLAGRHDSSRLVVVGEGVLLTYDLAAMLPKQIAVPGNTDAIFAGDDKLLTITSVAYGKWHWLDLVTYKSIAIDELQGMPMIVSVDPIGGRILVRETGPGPQGLVQRLVVLRVDRPERDVVAEAAKIWGRLIGGDTVVFEMGDGRLFARTGSKDPREVAKLDGAVRGLVDLGDHGFAASSSGGEVVRMDLRSGKLERVRVAVGTRGFVAADQGNRVVIIEDARLSLWDTAVTPIATFDKPIIGIDSIVGGVVVHFDDHEAQILDLKPNATPHRLMPFARRSPVVDAKGTLMAGLGTAQQLTILELPSRARWTVPNHFAALTKVLSVSPYTRKIVQGHNEGLALWQLPAADGDLKSWLESQSNALVDRDGVLAWPWQLPP
jgi:hypothetical protein